MLVLFDTLLTAQPCQNLGPGGGVATKKSMGALRRRQRWTVLRNSSLSAVRAGDLTHACGLALAGGWAVVGWGDGEQVEELLLGCGECGREVLDGGAVVGQVVVFVKRHRKL